MHPVLVELTTAQLEVLLAGVQGLSQEQRDLRAFLARLGLLEELSPATVDALQSWWQQWQASGGNSQTLTHLLATLVAERQQQLARQAVELVWSGPDPGEGAVTRDQAVLIRQLVERAQQRLLLTTYAVYRGPFVQDLFERVQRQMQRHPQLQVRLVCNIPRPRGSTVLSTILVQQFREQTWPRLWPASPQPQVYFDPRSLDPQQQAVCHVKAVVADQQLLVTSANLTDAAQLRNFELGLHLTSAAYADATWEHFDRLIRQGLLSPLFPGTASST